VAILSLSTGMVNRKTNQNIFSAIFFKKQKNFTLKKYDFEIFLAAYI